MISYVNPLTFRNEISGLWEESFGDGSEYSGYFLENCPEKECVVYLDGDCIAAFLFLIRGSIQRFDVRYLYAACTSVRYRNRGIMTSLINYVKDSERKKGTDGIFLVPAGASLFEYYSRRGFQVGFCSKETRLEYCCAEDSGAERIQYSPVSDVKMISDVKFEQLKNSDSFVFSRAGMEYYVNEHLFTGGQILASERNGKHGIVFFTLEGKNIRIREASGTASLNDLYKYLYGKYGTKNIYISEQLVYNNRLSSNDYTKCGMYCPLSVSFSNYFSGTGTVYSGLYLD